MSQGSPRRIARLGSRGGGLRGILRDLLFGFFFYGMHQQVYRVAESYRKVVDILILGDVLGIPVLGNYYTLRLLPYLVGDLEHARELALKDHDVLELLHEGAGAH